MLPISYSANKYIKYLCIYHIGKIFNKYTSWLEANEIQKLLTVILTFFH